LNLSRIRRLTGNQRTEPSLASLMLINLWAGLLFFAAFSVALH
jgi:hypothetical protein